MQLTVGDVAQLFRVNEQQVQRWVSTRQLPVRVIRGQQRIDRFELLGWAGSRHQDIAPPHDWGAHWGGSAGLSLSQALGHGGIHAQVPGSSQEEVLHAIAQRLPLPAEVDRDLLRQVWRSQRSLEPTSLLEGLTLPQPRSPVILPVPRPLLGLYFLEQGVTFPGSSVHTVFTLVCPNFKVYLSLLARLTSLLGDATFRGLIRDRAGAEAILNRTQRIESESEETAAAPRAEIG